VLALRRAPAPQVSAVFCGHEALSVDGGRVVDAQTDQGILKVLSKQLNDRLPAPQNGLDAFVSALKGLPPGLRAMAAIYQLDISISLDDFGWHFANWHHHGYSRETARGLRELGATRAAELYEAAYELAAGHWEQLGSSNFAEWYKDSQLEKALEPLNQEMWALYGAMGELGLQKLWVEYARRNPTVLRG